MLKEKIISMFNSEYTQVELSGLLGCSDGYIANTWIKHYGREACLSRKQEHYRKSKLGENNPMFGKTLELHHNYIGLVSDKKGYLLIKKPEWYTGRKKSKYIFYHNYVMCESLGLTEIPKGFCVHHIDGDKQNNNLSNLTLLSISAHCRLHQLQRKEAEPIKRK